ncbi:complement C1q domain-containing protein [Anaeromicropila herbilytica]|uniref:BclA C-terminal domain-containing protein n=1 Tax=Anaeromicropila herbilytica TaxID=2785025 RepID=A0A7R7IEK5_9FIRM|nr:hypothetical protein [Anaeromicropila herbilytica]BCN32106.1 hypothetical protein bsdtb5_34010 [Anaeromicropila herbilytica]
MTQKYPMNNTKDMVQTTSIAPYRPCPATINPNIQLGLGGIYNEINTTKTIPNGGVITFDRTPNDRVVGIGVSFDPTTGIITIQKASIYLFNWTFLATTTDPSGSIVIALENTNGQQYALSGNIIIPALTIANSFSGSTLLDLPIGTTLRFVNRSGHDIVLRPAIGTAGNAFSGSLTVTRIVNSFSSRG